MLSHASVLFSPSISLPQLQLPWFPLCLSLLPLSFSPSPRVICLCPSLARPCDALSLPPPPPSSPFLAFRLSRLGHVMYSDAMLVTTCAMVPCQVLQLANIAAPPSSTPEGALFRAASLGVHPQSYPPSGAYVSAGRESGRLQPPDCLESNSWCTRCFAATPRARDFILSITGRAVICVLKTLTSAALLTRPDRSSAGPLPLCTVWSSFCCWVNSRRNSQWGQRG